MESGIVIPWFRPLSQICRETNLRQLPPHLPSNATTNPDQHSAYFRRTVNAQKEETMSRSKFFSSFVVSALFLVS
jgi:hypothetical protein